MGKGEAPLEKGGRITVRETFKGKGRDESEARKSTSVGGLNRERSYSSKPKKRRVRNDWDRERRTG